MTPFERILIPTDLSDFAVLPLRYAAFFRKTLGSRLTLLFVEDNYIPIESVEMPLAYALESAPSKEELMKKLIAQARTHLPDARVETVVVTDSPSTAIVRTADEMKSDLIIMGTHARQGLQRALLGSVTERVLRHTDRTVLTVTPRLLPADLKVAVRTILCPVNFTSVAREALIYAADLAHAFDAELVVTYVAEEIAAQSLSSAELGSWIAPAIGSRIRYRETIARGDAAEKVLDTAHYFNADLIVMGARHRFFSDSTVIGTTTQRVVRLSSVPVVTVSRKPVAMERHAERPASASL